MSKKFYFYFMVPLAALVLSGCSNDEYAIDSISTEKGTVNEYKRPLTEAIDLANNCEGVKSRGSDYEISFICSDKKTLIHWLM